MNWHFKIMLSSLSGVWCHVQFRPSVPNRESNSWQGKELRQLPAFCLLPCEDLLRTAVPPSFALPLLHHRAYSKKKTCHLFHVYHAYLAKMIIPLVYLHRSNLACVVVVFPKCVLSYLEFTSYRNPKGLLDGIATARSLGFFRVHRHDSLRHVRRRIRRSSHWCHGRFPFKS